MTSSTPYLLIFHSSCDFCLAFNCWKCRFSPPFAIWMPNNFCLINTASSLFRIPWIAKQRKTRCCSDFLLCVLEGKGFYSQALPMHSYFAYCSSTWHISIPILPGWGLQVLVMHSQFLKPGAHCRSLWNWPLCAASSRSESGARFGLSLPPYAMGNTSLSAQSQRGFPPSSHANLKFEIPFCDSIEILLFLSDSVHHITVFGAEGIYLSSARCKCASLVWVLVQVMS